MREILFKAKRVDNGNWVEGYLIRHAEGRSYIQRNVNSDKIIVNTSTVCQFTGLKDKNGVKIFEGDVLQRYKKSGEPYKNTKTVEFDICSFAVPFPLSEHLIIKNIHD